MTLKTKQTIRRYVYLVAAVLAGVAEVVRNAGDITSMTWQEIFDRGLKGIPFVLLGYIAKRNLDEPPPKE